MRKMYVKYFYSGTGYKELVEFVNENNIQQADIVSITEDNGNYSLFFYH